MSKYAERERKRGLLYSFRRNWLAMVGVAASALSYSALRLWVFQGTSEPRYETGEIIWGQESNGLQAGIELVTVEEGTRLVCRFHIKNVGSRPLHVLRIVEQKERSGQMPVRVFNRGREVFYSWHKHPHRSPWRNDMFVVVRPGETHVEQRRVDLLLWNLEHKYDVLVCYNFMFTGDEIDRQASVWATGKPFLIGHPESSDLWTGEMMSGYVNVVRRSAIFSFR